MTSNWSLDKESLESIVQILSRLTSLEFVLEFGSGQSSHFLANRFVEAYILSVEHELFYFEKQNKLKRHQNLQFILCPLEFQLIESYYYLSFKPFFMHVLQEQTIDAVIIDGPPFYTLRGREAILYHLYSNLKPGGFVILDDYQRLKEQNIVKNWMSVYKDSFELEIINIGHQLAVLKKVKSVIPNWHADARCIDANYVNEIYLKMASVLNLVKSLPINHEYSQLFMMMKEYFSTYPSIESVNQVIPEIELSSYFLELLIRD